MKFELEVRLRGASGEELLEDLRRSANALRRKTIAMVEYEEAGKIHPSTIQRRFGLWPEALKLAGLQSSRLKIGISDDEFFKNVKSLWIILGRQPRYTEVKAPNFLFSVGTYENRFGSWSKALGKFVEWVNSDSPNQSQGNVEEQSPAAMPTQTPSAKRRTCREISDRQKFRILVRDGFRCKSCGASPLMQPTVELHVDHILLWSKGGEITDDNLERKCKQCNLGKGNAFNA